MKLTDAGERYYVQIREVLELLDAADEEVNGKVGDIRGWCGSMLRSPLVICTS